MGNGPRSINSSLILGCFENFYESWLGMHRVGAWRLLDMFKELGLPCAMLLNSELYNHCPELMAESRKLGHEVVGHSRTNSEWQVS